MNHESSYESVSVFSFFFWDEGYRLRFGLGLELVLVFRLGLGLELPVLFSQVKHFDS